MGWFYPIRVRLFFYLIHNFVASNIRMMRLQCTYHQDKFAKMTKIVSKQNRKLCATETYEWTVLVDRTHAEELIFADGHIF